MKRKICVVTGTRAEYGLLQNLMSKIKEDNDLILQIIATGMHLSPEFGLTYTQIERDGFTIDEKVEALLSSDTSIGVIKSIGLTTIGFAEAFKRLQPDLVIILGDRFEMLAVAQSSLIMKIPIAHIHGGECTFGAYDDAIRHSITKMSNWHFTSTEAHKKRVIQLGEHPNRVWNVGAVGIDNMMNIPLMSKEELYRDLQLNAENDSLLITYHPLTNGNEFGIDELLDALNKFKHYNLVFTKSNADNGGRYINQQIEKFISNVENAYLFDSLGQLRYLSMVKHAKAVLGNSSSALIEVPYLSTPSVNIGSRQAGREKPNCVIDCEPISDKIVKAILQACSYQGEYQRIFGDGNATEKILGILRKLPSFSIEKGFYDL